MLRATMTAALALLLACSGPARTPNEAPKQETAAADSPGTGGPTGFDPEQPDPTREHRAALKSALAPILGAEDAPPFVAAGFWDGKRVTYVGFGSGPEEVEPESVLFHVASLTKPHTALLTALLVDEGTLDLEKPLFPCRRRRPRALCSRGTTTLRHLLSHCAGLRIVPEDSGGDYDAAKLRAYLRKYRPREKPGEKFRYSTTGYGVIALAIERATKMPFAQALQSRILEPIGSTAVIEVGDAERLRLAQGHRADGTAAEAGPTRDAFIASGGLVASAADLMALLRVYADPSRRPEWEKAIMLTRQVDTKLVGFDGAAVALGWQFHRKSGIFWHPGVSSVHRTVMAYDPGFGTAVVLLANRFMAVDDHRLDRAAIEVLVRARKAPHPRRGEGAEGWGKTKSRR